MLPPIRAYKQTRDIQIRSIQIRTPVLGNALANYHVQMFVDFDGGFTADEYEKRVTLVALSVESIARAD